MTNSGSQLWVRVSGPEETFSCGDVAYETGSLYKCGNDCVEIVYFVEDHGGFYTVEYRIESYKVDADNDLIESSVEVSYDYQTVVRYHTVADAIAVADAAASADETWWLNTSIQ